MPELPEVETVARGLHRVLPGDAIVSVQILRNTSIGTDIVQFASDMVGHCFKSVRRRGKYILIDFDNDAGLVCHLRMSGRLLIRPDAKPQDKRFLRVRIGLESGRQLHFEDMRVFGRLWYKPVDMTFEQIVPTLGELGVEPLDDLTARFLLDAFAGKQQAIKTALLDQRIIAGVGNIYADESLFLAGIHPARPGNTLHSHEIEKLHKAIQTVLARAIAHHGSSLGRSSIQNYARPGGEAGEFQGEHKVFQRTGEPCLACGEQIQRIVITQRSTHFCPVCQQ